MEFNLFPEAPFDYELSLAYYTRSRFEIVDLVKDNCYYRLIPCNGNIYPVKVKSSGTIEKPEIVVDIVSEKTDKTVQKMIADYIKTLFRTDYNITDFYEFVSNDPVLSKLIEVFYGLKNPQTIDLFEALVWAITGQQINLNFAYMLKKSLVEKFGVEYHIEDNQVFVFPTPATLAEVDIEQLREMKYSRNKAEYIIGLARAIDSGKIKFDGIDKMSDNAVREQLLAIRGVGRWTCEYCLLRSLSRQDACLSGDAGLKNALIKFYGLKKTVKEIDIDQFMKRFEPYRGLATFYLWYGLSRLEE
jgi:DNA-3-methyladenine glycosylase II